MGVWIETKLPTPLSITPTVTPFVGVWIETLKVGVALKAVGHTLRGCVDWNVSSFFGCSASRVTPFVGVWIETKIFDTLIVVDDKSHPSWVCGLKLLTKLQYESWRKSHPSWVCGLKQEKRKNRLNLADVTPFVGVWIETCKDDIEKFKAEVTPFVGVWIETPSPPTTTKHLSRHTLRGCVDWNYVVSLADYYTRSHTLRGCVDWNQGNKDEMSKELGSHPSWVCGLKLTSIQYIFNR